MLRKFRVSNFKSFENDFELDLTNVNGYEFNKNSVKNGIVNNAIIYGQNGVGKSNLAHAILDIKEHLTDSPKNEEIYKNYLNAYTNSPVASFYYEFLIDSKIVVYEYKKSDYKTIVYERFQIDNETFALFDRTQSTHATINFEGAETLNKNIENDELSVLKYVKNNSVLVKNNSNSIFLSFFIFVNQLYSRKKTYSGFNIEQENPLEEIAKAGEIKNFEIFLNQAGVECELFEVEEFGIKTIVFNLEGKLLPFFEVASTGTIALSIFYVWYYVMKTTSRISLFFIDEFDAFYHHSLATLIVEKLKETGVQFILTTHNTSNMTNDLLRPDCYFEMTKKQIRSFSKSTQKELREAHNLEKMYKAGSFDVK